MFIICSCSNSLIFPLNYNLYCNKADQYDVIFDNEYITIYDNNTMTIDYANFKVWGIYSISNDSLRFTPTHTLLFSKKHIEIVKEAHPTGFTINRVFKISKDSLIDITDISIYKDNPSYYNEWGLFVLFETKGKVYYKYKNITMSPL